MAKQTHPSVARIKHVGKFGLVGILNTALDFTIYNVLSVAGLTLIQANIISTTAAMVVSFFANKHVVFKKTDGSLRRQIVIFYAVTAFGLYVLQTGTIKILTEVWFWPMHEVLLMIHLAGIYDHDRFIIKNGAKGIATIISLTWNYIMYKRVVFK